MAAKKHHGSAIVTYLGPSSPLPLADLPTLRDILKQCQLLREQYTGENIRNYSVAQMSSDVLPLILGVYERAHADFVQIPIRFSDGVIMERIQRRWTTLSNIANKRVKVNAREKESFVGSLDCLFNILRCECDFVTCADAKQKCLEENCQKVHINCTCPITSKIPKLELEFIRDQRSKSGSKGKLQMGLGDAKETSRIAKATKRKELELARKEKKNEKKRKEEEDLEERARREEEERKEEEKEESYHSKGEASMPEMDVDASYSNERVERAVRSKNHTQNRTPLPTLAQSITRGNVSVREAAIIATSTLIDYNIITPTDRSQIITPDKIQREVTKYRESVADLVVEEQSPIKCILFDGRNDHTRVVLEDEAGKRYPGFRMEEHVTLTSEPGGDYVAHLSPAAKDAETIADELYMFIVDHAIDKTLEYIGGDSVVVNTGTFKGIMRRIEEKLGRRLMRIVCELHTNELPFRHIIEELDGPTSGATSFSGMHVCVFVCERLIGKVFK